MFNKQERGVPQRRAVPAYEATKQPVVEDRIRESMLRKEQKIADHIENKEMSIVITSSIRDAVLFCTNHPIWQTTKSESDRFAWIDTVARKFIEYHVTERPTHEALYSSLTFDKDDVEIDEPKEIRYDE